MRCLFASFAFAASLTGTGYAQDYPSRQITLIVPFAAGGTSDIIARIAADELSQILNQKIIIENIGGAGPALNDAMGGHVDGVCDAATSVAGAINGKQMRGLVIASRKRASLLPDVSTAAEAGLPAFTNEGWNALLAPKGTPVPLIAKLNAALRKAIASEKVTKRLADLAAAPAIGDELSPDALKAFIEVEIKKYRDLLAP